MHEGACALLSCNERVRDIQIFCVQVVKSLVAEKEPPLLELRGRLSVMHKVCKQPPRSLNGSFVVELVCGIPGQSEVWVQHSLSCGN